MDSLLIVLVVTVLAALSNWLQQRAQSRHEPPPDTNRPPQPRPQPRTRRTIPAPTAPQPRAESSLERELRRLLGEEIPQPPRPRPLWPSHRRLHPFIPWLPTRPHSGPIECRRPLSSFSRPSPQNGVTPVVDSIARNNFTNQWPSDCARWMRIPRVTGPSDAPTRFHPRWPKLMPSSASATTPKQPVKRSLPPWFLAHQRGWSPDQRQPLTRRVAGNQRVQGRTSDWHLA
jgi:hypothetical protein